MADGGDGDSPADVATGEAPDDPAAMAALLFDLLHDIANSHPNPIAKRIVPHWIIEIDKALEYLAAEANSRGENYGRDLRNMLRDRELRELGKTKTAKVIAEAIADAAESRSAIELLSANPYEPETFKYKIRQVLMFNGGVTLGEPRIRQILKSDTI